jgi:hypothetical protein
MYVYELKVNALLNLRPEVQIQNLYIIGNCSITELHLQANIVIPNPLLYLLHTHEGLLQFLMIL